MKTSNFILPVAASLAILTAPAAFAQTSTTTTNMVQSPGTPKTETGRSNAMGTSTDRTGYGGEGSKRSDAPVQNQLQKGTTSANGK